MTRMSRHAGMTCMSRHAGMTRVTAPGPFVRVTASQQSAHASSQRTEPAMPNRRGMFLRAGGTVCLLAITSVAAYAQTPPAVPSGPLTLEQVLTLAEPRSEAVVIAQAGVRRAEGELVRARSGRYPQLSAAASYDRSLASEFEGVFEGDSGCAPLSVNPQAPIEARVAELERAVDCGAVGGGFFGGGGTFRDLPFGRKNTWRASLTFSQSLYSGGRLGAQADVANLGQDSAGLALTTARAQMLYEVTQAYYDAVLSDRLVAIAAATLEQAGATLKQTQAGFEAGTQPEFEVLRARVSRDNQSPILIRQRANREVAMFRLKQLLDLPDDYQLQLTDALSDESLPPPPVFAERVANVERSLRPEEIGGAVTLRFDAPLPERTAVVEAATSVRQREAALRLVQAEKMPSVQFNSSYVRIAYPEGAFPAFDRSNWLVGVSMSVPILTGGRQKGDEAVARAELEQSRAQRQQVEELANVDTRSALAELLAARAAWAAMAGTVQQAQRAHQIANVRFTNGVSTQLELSDARVSLQQAEANRTVAARDLQVARARVALLPNLPVSAPSGVMPPRVPQPQSPTVPAPQQPQAGGQIRNASAQGAQAQVGLQ
jgi:outer membrane protein